MTNDARSKLRSMGGIMASSPELMQVAQKFQVGGRVSAGPSPLRTIPTVRQPEMPELGPRNPGYDPKIFRSGTIDPVLAGTRRVAPLSPTQARRNAILERAAVGSPTYGSGAQPLPSSPDMPFEPRVPMGPEAGFPERAADRVIENLIAGEISSLEQEEITVDDLLDVSISRGIPIQELVDMMPEGVKSKVEASVERRMGERLPVPTIGDRVSPLAPRRRPSIVGRDVESLEGPEATGLGGQMRPTREMIDEDIVMSQGVPRQALGLSEDDEAMPPMIADDPEGTAEEALSSLDKSYEEKLALFNKVFGDSDEQDSKDKAMNLAMIGLAIAAGQSPNALTNIAQGLMVGAKGIGAQRKERQAKREKVKVMALDAALKEEAAQQEFARELGLEAIKAGNKSQYRDTPNVRQAGGFGDLEVYLPTPEAARQGVAPVLADPKNMDKIYKQSLEGRQKVFGMVDQAEALIEQYDIAGFDGALARMKQDFGAAVPSVLKEAFGFDGGSGEPSPQQQYDTIMRAMAAQFTPIILGESGRTISDGDRQRVAEILGFAVDTTTGKIGQYTGTSLTSEAELKSALREVRSILGGNYSEMDRIYQRYRPEQYQAIMESNSKKESPSRITYDASGRRVQ